MLLLSAIKMVPLAHTHPSTQACMHAGGSPRLPQVTGHADPHVVCCMPSGHVGEEVAETVGGVVVGGRGEGMAVGATAE